jgi:hypothetical protein
MVDENNDDSLLYHMQVQQIRQSESLHFAYCSSASSDFIVGQFHLELFLFVEKSSRKLFSFIFFFLVAMTVQMATVVLWQPQTTTQVSGLCDCECCPSYVVMDVGRSHSFRVPVACADFCKIFSLFCISPEIA